MSARRGALGHIIPGSDVDPMHVLRLWCHGSLGLEGASIIVCDAYGNTVHDLVPVSPGMPLSRLVEDHDNWSLGEILLLRNNDVRTSLRVDFAAILVQCRELILPFPDKASNVPSWAIQALDALQDSGEAGTRVALLDASEADQLAKIDALERHEWELLDENRRLEHQVARLRAE